MLRINKLIISRSQELLSCSDLEINCGKTVAFIGRNGAGKSTFFESFFETRLKTGDIFINDQSIDTMSQKEKVNFISHIDNHFNQDSNLRVHEFLRLGRYNHTNLFDRLNLEDIKIIESFVQQLSLKEFLNKGISELSDGEKQRVNLAKALIQESPLMLLDEPTAFLDFPSKMATLDLLTQIAKANNKLIIFSTHDVHYALEKADGFILIPKDSKELIYFEKAPSIDQLIAICF